MALSDKFERPDADGLAVAAIGVGAILVLLVIGRVFKDVQPI